MIRSQIPRFRLPESVIDEEVGYIVGMGGIETRFGQRVDSLAGILAEGYDAIFVGTGAPRGRDLDIPGRREAAANIHIGIDWLSSVSFGHVEKIGRRVIVLGGGNTAMDCCRTSRRLGGDDVKVIVRSGFEEMKASPWEKEDAMHEGIPILNFLVPKEFTHADGKLTGVTFEKVAARLRRQGTAPARADRRAGRAFRMRRRAGRRRPGERLPVDRARHRRRLRPVRHAGRRSRDASSRRCPRSSSAAIRPSGRRTSSGRWRTATRPRSRSTSCAAQADVRQRPPPHVTLISQKMGIHEWSYDNEISLDRRKKVPLRDQTIALHDVKAEVELGFDRLLGYEETQRCLNCDVETVFADTLCIECDACVDICPMDCITFTPNAPEDAAQDRAERAGLEPDAGPLHLTSAEDGPDHGQGRGCLPALRPLRRALPDRRLGHAEIPPRHEPRGGPFRKLSMSERRSMRVNDFVVKFANVNGSGSASANRLFARSILRMGVPVASRNIFPSNIQGLPTWYEVRVSEAGHIGRRGGVDLMVAMNPQTWDQDVAEIDPGGYPLLRLHQADAGLEVPRGHQRHRHAADGDLQRALQRSAPAPALQEHHLCRRADRAARHRDRARSRS